MHNGVVVSVVRGAERVARAQAAQVRALGRPAHAHPADEPAPRAHHLTHGRYNNRKINITNLTKSATVAKAGYVTRIQQTKILI